LQNNLPLATKQQLWPKKKNKNQMLHFHCHNIILLLPTNEISLNELPL